MISLEKWDILTPLQKLPKNVGYLGKIIVAKCFKSGPKSNKSANLVTLQTSFDSLWNSDICQLDALESTEGKKCFQTLATKWSKKTFKITKLVVTAAVVVVDQ